jgi:hypothetical protein
MDNANGGGGDVTTTPTVEFGTVVEAVVRNAMERLILKQQTLQDRPGHVRKLELARYFEETRRQLTSVLALLRWQQQRLKVTAQCEGLLEQLRRHQSHITGTSVAMYDAAERAALLYRTPMYDIRTAVDVLAVGTYRGLPSMEIERIIAPRVTESEKVEVIKQLDFMLRAELLRLHIPPELSKVEVRNGRLILESADEYELELSMRLDLPQRPFRVNRLELLVKSVGGVKSPCQSLADLLERRMALEREPLSEAVRILGDAARMRTWHILLAQSHTLLLFPKVDVEATTTSFVVFYWQESPMLSFEALMTPAVRADTAFQQDQHTNTHTAAAKSSMAMAAHTMGRAPCLVLLSNRDTESHVQIKHIPPLVQSNGQVLTIPLAPSLSRARRSISAQILDYTAIYVSSYYQTCPHTAIYVSSYCYI